MPLCAASPEGVHVHKPLKVMSYSRNQPNNEEAWRLGKACRAAAEEPKCGDPIDRGLILMRELEACGFGIVLLQTVAKPAAGV